MPSCVNSPTGPSEVCLVAAGNLQDCLMGPVEGKYVPPPAAHDWRMKRKRIIVYLWKHSTKKQVEQGY